MGLIPGPTITAPEPIRRRPGLFDAASGPLNLPAHGEGGGVSYVPVTCGEAIPYGINCYQGEVAAPAKPTDGDAAQVETGVFAAVSALLCSSVGYSLPEFRAKVRRKLEGAEQGAVEQGFWTGEDASGNPMDILNLEKTATAIFTSGDAGEHMTGVLARLEDWLYREQGYGYAGYIHAPASFAPYAAEAGLIIPESYSNPMTGRKSTPNGSVWVFGGGYPGTGAGGASGWPGGGFMHITGQVTVWRAPEISIYDAFNQESNERYLVAERAYAVSYDCHNARVEFNPLGLS